MVVSGAKSPDRTRLTDPLLLFTFKPMLKKTLYTFLFLSALPALCFSEETKPAAQAAPKPVSLEPHHRFMDEVFVVETSESDMDDSLNRISGTGDRGYAPEEYTYKSPNHTTGGPFGRQEAYDNSESHSY